MGGMSAPRLSRWFLCRVASGFSRSGLRGASGRPGTCWAPARITGRGHRRPRLSRLGNLPDHHWALNIPGVWGRSPHAFGRFDPLDALLEDGLEPWIVVVGVVADDIDGFAVVVGGLAVIAAGFADHAETVIAVVDIGEAREQAVGGPFGGIEIAGLDHVDHGVGCLGQFVAFIVFLDIAGYRRPARRRRGRLSGTCGTCGGLVT